MWGQAEGARYTKGCNLRRLVYRWRMLTIAGGIVLGFLLLGAVRAVFGGPSEDERRAAEIHRVVGRD